MISDKVVGVITVVTSFDDKWTSMKELRKLERRKSIVISIALRHMESRRYQFKRKVEHENWR